MGCNSTTGQATNVTPPGAVPRSQFVDCTGRSEICVVRDGRMVVETPSPKDAQTIGSDCQSEGIPTPDYAAASAAIRAYTQDPALKVSPLKTKCPTGTTW